MTKRTADPAIDSDDTAQTAALALAQAAADGRTIADPEAYARTVRWNVRAQTGRARPRALLSDVADRVREASPAWVAEHGELGHMLGIALSRLPAATAYVLSERARGRSDGDIAATLDISRSAVTQRALRGLALLRRDAALASFAAGAIGVDR